MNIFDPLIMKVCFIPDQSSNMYLTLNFMTVTVTVDELTTMALSCYIDSNPRSTITLFNNSMNMHMPLLQETHTRLAEYTWDEAGCLDTGNYTCEADNGIKSAVRKSVQLIVRCELNTDVIQESSICVNKLLSGIVFNDTPT